MTAIFSNSCVAIGAVQNRSALKILKAPTADALRGDSTLSPVRIPLFSFLEP